MIKDALKLSGEVSIVLKDKDGNIKDERHIRNLIVDTGLDFIASRMEGTTKGVMTHMALGSSTTAAAAGDTDVISVLGSREVLDSTTATGNSVAYVSSFEAGKATGAVTEAGLFNAVSGGDMLCRTVFAVVNKGASDIMNITWTITISAV